MTGALAVEPLSVEEAALFLLRWGELIAPSASLRQAAPRMVQQAQALAQTVDRIPLALDQLGAVLKTAGGDLSRLLPLTPQERVTLLRQRGVSLDRSHPETLPETIRHQCERLTPDALDLVRLFACCPPNALPDELSALRRVPRTTRLPKLAMDPLRLDEARAELLRGSLVHKAASRSGLGMYALVQVIIQETLSRSQLQLYQKLATGG